MKFKPEDFLFDGEDTDAGPTFLAHMACTFANKRLAEMVAEAPAVYSKQLSGKWDYWAMVEEPFTEDTHTAKLVCIEEIGK